MVVNLIMRSCRPRSLANQIGPAGQRRQRAPTYLARDNRFLGGDHRMGLLGIAIGRQVLAATLSAHGSAAFGVRVLAGFSGDDAGGDCGSDCVVAEVIAAVEEPGEHVDDLE